MAFSPLLVTILGEPSVWAGSDEKVWKEKVFAASSNSFEEGGYSQPIREGCTVELAFYLSRARLYRLDIDNLLKPAIDALGTAIFPPGKTGQQYDSEDVWIRKIVAQKLIDDSNPRLEIRVSPWAEA
jgi:Holliday junction resolvase RusA-like endonuclease